jgi:hypothetical protein
VGAWWPLPSHFLEGAMTTHLAALAAFVRFSSDKARLSLEAALESDMPESARQSIFAAIAQLQGMDAAAKTKLAVVAEVAATQQQAG